ncbi:beta-N-acetylhexosaminidase [Mucilaginibacter sabulilitoris]|uniref:beta-N-acetylhexosaminidase n=1 Tax=Mucilaginibacter sabulilitoris TaxID=1173583 RepID=A0ABZ0TFM6_9SPHI|nr:beta-N-acetylhexosaminidase [Mucilaginibacter sabulilitoris]WPU91371.1 beta-N-acetylhexosaminidase [Mucilaginibacter sabulilitoris]
MKLKLFTVLFLLSGYVQAQNLTIIPQPKSIINGTGQFNFNNHATVSVSDTSLLGLAGYLQKEISQTKGLTLTVSNNEAAGAINLVLANTPQTTGSYTLNVTTDRITITSQSKEGIFYGLTSLLQLVKDQQRDNDGDLCITTCNINDAPRYPWRGLMLDESRHFFGKEKVKQLLNWMAYYKLNRFHWHLTDAQGWRIEIKKYPKLTSIGGASNYSNTSAEPQYYTQDDIKEIVAYAAARFITVIPEIDMPGHATAANKAYPEFSGGSVAGYPNFTFNPANEHTYQYLADIIKETNALFPAHMIHLGGDEVAYGIKAWSLDTAIAHMMQKMEFEGVTDLEHYFFKRMADTVTNMGSKVLAWDEATGANLPADKTIIFWWRQNLPGQLHLALQKNYQVVLCPRLPLYFDFEQDSQHVSGRKWNGVVNRITDVYNFPDRQISPDELNSKQIIGVQANIWTERIASEKRLDFMLFPRIAGLAEAGWTAPEQKDEFAFNERLKSDLKNYDSAGIYYYDPFDPSYHPEAIDFAPRVIEPTTPKHSRHTLKKSHVKASKKSKKGAKKSSGASGKSHKKRK